MTIILITIIVFDYRESHFELMVDKVEVTVTDLEKNINENQDTKACILLLNMCT